MGIIDDLFSLSGRVALITGASSGIGRHASVVLASAGADIIACGRDVSRLRDVCDEISDYGVRVSDMEADLCSEGDCSDFAHRCEDIFGHVDILLNTAGQNPRLPAEDMDLSVWDMTLNLNLRVPFFLSRALVPGMISRGGGNILNFGSLQSFRAFANSAPYGASKGGITQLTRAMSEAWGKDGIICNALAPGFFPTALTSGVFSDSALRDHHARSTAVGRNGLLEDLDGALIFFSSRACNYIHGQVLAVDGGYLAT